MISTNQTSDNTLFCAVDSVAAITGQISEYADACWANGNMVPRHVPPADVLQAMRDRLSKLDLVLKELESATLC